MAARPSQQGICPHCKVGVRYEVANVIVGTVDQRSASFQVQTAGSCRLHLDVCSCPSCGRPIIHLASIRLPNGAVEQPNEMLFPSGLDRPIPAEVESAAPELAADFREAVAVFPKGKQASAALSRRYLQLILKEKGGATKRDLSDQIDEVLPKLPTELAANVDAIRQVGNFAAHPLKSQSTGEIVKVEDGEAEWLLDVLEELFDYYYVAPVQAASKRAALNKKLSDLGKPPMKGPSP